MSDDLRADLDEMLRQAVAALTRLYEVHRDTDHLDIVSSR